MTPVLTSGPLCFLGLTLVSQTASPAVTALGQWLETLNVGGILQGSSDATSMAASSVGGKWT